jgi:shikimate kinase
LGYSFLDLDDLIEQRAQKTIREIFQTEGEETFRFLETDALASLRQRRKLVTALGGGTPIRTENQLILRDNFCTVFLEISFDTFRRRTGGDPTRPLLQKTNEELLALHEKRLPIYRSLGETLSADHTSPLMLVEEILQRI